LFTKRDDFSCALRPADACARQAGFFWTKYWSQRDTFELNLDVEQCILSTKTSQQVYCGARHDIGKRREISQAGWARACGESLRRTAPPEGYCSCFLT
jgi:hypothetical protein